ncbi:MAG: hypothetical protein KDA52_13480, partial [Planctomycetaceae bacterium]|nr:hypothetical protein [Planctomycetaceae bacterium]
NQLINRSLDAALRDLRFFGRDHTDASSPKKKAKQRIGSERSSGNGQNDRPLPPKIGSVLSQLFGQLATAFDDAATAREVAGLITQIPTCLKALAYAVVRWIPRSQSRRVLNHHFHKVAIACLAPGVSSTLHKHGAVRRVLEQKSSEWYGGSDFELGVAMLEAFLLLQFQTANDEYRRVLKDMHDVLCDLSTVELAKLNAAGSELDRIGHAKQDTSPEFETLRWQVDETIGELAGLRDCRAALRQLIAMAGQGVRSKAELHLLAAKASGAGDSDEILTVIEASGSRARLVEIPSDETACTECYTTLPVSVCSLLNNTTRVWRCSCGVLLARSLEQ